MPEPEKKERNIEIYERKATDKWTLRKIGEHYNLHWTTVNEIYRREKGRRELSTENTCAL